MAQSHQHSASASESDRQLLEVLDGRSCPFCEEGHLERGTYKDNRAVVCDNCGTPRAQVWTES